MDLDRPPEIREMPDVRQMSLRVRAAVTPDVQAACVRSPQQRELRVHTGQ